MRNKKLFLCFVILSATIVSARAQSSFRDFADSASATMDAARESREQNAAPTDVRAIFAKARAEEEDGNVNFCGFYTGMSRADADALAAHYGLKTGEGTFVGNPVHTLQFTLHGVRRITKGGNTFDELAQAVANRIGSMKHDWQSDSYEMKTIDGVFVTMSEASGLTLFSSQVKIESDFEESLRRASEAAERREREAAERREREAAEAAERREQREAAWRREREAAERREHEAAERRESTERELQPWIASNAKRLEPFISVLLEQMVLIPGKDFRIGAFEVTQSQWEEIMGNNPARFKGPKNPVETVSWNECQVFLLRLNALPSVKESGLVFRLPTAEEWEFVCRAEVNPMVCDYYQLVEEIAQRTEESAAVEVSADEINQVAWFGANSNGKTHPVGQKKPNAFGVYDMYGNVCEWTQTTDGEDYGFCGGGWMFSAKDCGPSTLNWLSPDDRDDYLGFRLCAYNEITESFGGDSCGNDENALFDDMGSEHDPFDETGSESDND